MKVYSFKNGSTTEVDDNIGNSVINKKLIYYVAKAEGANKRSGTASTKTRAEVRGGGIKPWSQKGLGRARSGSNRSPLWVGGGVVFGPQPHSYKEKINKKVRRSGIKNALAMRRNSIAKLVDLEMEKPSTKLIKEWLENKSLNNVLFVLNMKNDIFVRSVRNMPDCKCVNTSQLTITDILNYKEIIFVEEK